MVNLNPKQIAFCEQYVIDLNATQAAIRAGYSAKTANVKASQLLAIVNIQEYIKELRDKASKRNEISLDRVVQELTKLALFDVRKIYDDNGDLIQPHKLSDEAASVVSSFKSRREVSGSGEDKEVSYVDEYKTYDKTKALEMLMRHLGGYEKDNTQQSNVIVVGTPKELT